MSDHLTHSQETEPVSGDRVKKDEWVRATLGTDPVRLRRGAIIGAHRAPPQWVSAKPTQDAPEGKPKIGEERDLEGKFLKQLNESMNALQIARSLKPASKKAETAATAMEQSLADMHKAIKEKDFVTAGNKLDEALRHGETVSDERVKAKKLFDDAFYPLQEQLNASLERTKDLKGIAAGVGVAEQTARDAAAAAEQAAGENDYALADEKLKLFDTAMTELGTAYKAAADALDKEVTKKLGRLKRRAEGLEGTTLTTEAAAATDAANEVEQAQKNANSATPQEARLAALVAARDKADEADAAAQLALKTKFNTSAANGLAEIRKAAGTAVAGLTDGDPKTGLLDRLKEWDKQKRACDDEKDLGKQKTALATLDSDARRIMADASALEIAAKKNKAVNDARSAGDLDGEVRALIAAAKNAIAALTNGDAKTALEKEAEASEEHYDDWFGDPPSDQRTDQLSTHPPYWPELLERALKAAAEEKRQAAFKAALEQRFGLTITIPPAMENTHFDQFYDMMDRLPIQQTSQSSLKELTYDKSSSGAAFWPGGPGKVEMGNFGAAETWDYKNPVTGATEPMTAFSINSLHEIGHAVDEKYGIMAKNSKNPGCGKWEDETLDSVIKAFIKDLKATAGNALTADDPTLTMLFDNALTKAAIVAPSTNRSSVKDTDDSEKPGTMGDPEWQIVKGYLNKAVQIREDNWPWGTGKEVTLDGRAYHESYSGSWVSYDPTARTGTEVRDYQFRSPAEWFAELYAYTWFKKMKAPAGVDKSVTKYMYSAKA